jgi:hypothetical protein
MIRITSLLALWVIGSVTLAADPQIPFQAVECEGVYPHHLQGVCTDGREAIFWSFTTKLVKTDRHGNVVKQIEVGNHHGDLCYHQGQVFVAVNFGKFNDAKGNADSWVYVYAGDDLSLVAKHPAPELIHGAGGIAHHDGKFFVVGGLPPGAKGNSVYEYEDDFKFVKEHRLPGDYTLMGIQTAAFAEGHWWFGCYGNPKILLKTDERFQSHERFEFDGSLGIVPLGQSRFLIGRDSYSKEKGHTGSLMPAELVPQQGLRLIDGRP